MLNMAAILKFKMAAPGGVSEVGSNRQMILHVSSNSLPSFVISPQSEIFGHIFDLTTVLNCFCLSHPENKDFDLTICNRALLVQLTTRTKTVLYRSHKFRSASKQLAFNDMNLKLLVNIRKGFNIYSSQIAELNLTLCVFFSLFSPLNDATARLLFIHSFFFYYAIRQHMRSHYKTLGVVGVERGTSETVKRTSIKRKSGGRGICDA